MGRAFGGVFICLPALCNIKHISLNGYYEFSRFSWPLVVVRNMNRKI
jgi:hypothetical protein